MNHIFISHSHEDIDFAENLHSRLTQAGFTMWRDTGIRGGEDWRREIDDAIKDASTLLVIMTPAAKASEYVTYEWAFAWGAGVKVIPILLKETELHPRLEALQHLDFTNRNVRPWDNLIELLRQAESSKPHVEQLVYRMHEYSGAWDVENRFSRWRDFELGGDDTVYWHGKTFLLLSESGTKGNGAQIGKLYISIGKYKAIYDNVNRINRANVTEDGTLHLDLQVILRIRTEEEGESPEARFREGLFGSGEYHLELKPVHGASPKLQGKHLYVVANKVFQEAEEYWTYLGL